MIYLLEVLNLTMQNICTQHTVPISPNFKKRDAINCICQYIIYKQIMHITLNL